MLARSMHVNLSRLFSYQEHCVPTYSKAPKSYNHRLK